MGTTQFSTEQMRQLVDRTHAAGLPVTAHAHSVPGGRASDSGRRRRYEALQLLDADRPGGPPMRWWTAAGSGQAIVVDIVGAVSDEPAGRQEVDTGAGIPAADRTAPLPLIHGDGLPDRITSHDPHDVGTRSPPARPSTRARPGLPMSCPCRRVRGPSAVRQYRDGHAGPGEYVAHDVDGAEVRQVRGRHRGAGRGSIAPAVSTRRRGMPGKWFQR